jgi:4-hydroxy-tetrahydrodipicolinate synthase
VNWTYRTVGRTLGAMQQDLNALAARPGLYVPLMTPFDESGAVALACLRALAHAALDGGATGLVALGTTAEPGSLSSAERQDVLEVVAGVCNDRAAPLIVGANTPMEIAQLAGVDGVTAALTLVPPFLRPGENGVVAYFEALAAASPVPLLVYHVPYRTGQELLPRTIHRLAALPGVAGMKFAPGALTGDAVAILADPPPRFAVLGGDDALLAPMLALGAHGAIAASAHIGTSGYAALVAAWRSGDVVVARDLGHRLAALSTALFAEPNPTVIKAVLHAQGRIPTSSVRLPLVAAGRSALDAALYAAALV